MLEIKVATAHEIDIIQNILDHQQVDLHQLSSYISNCMIVYDNENPVGTAGFIQNKDIAELQFVVIHQNRQREYLGDGLIKSLLNLADRKGIKQVFVNPKAHPLFFKKVGFKKVSLEELNLYNTLFSKSLAGKENQLLKVQLPDFFSSACKFHK